MEPMNKRIIIAGLILVLFIMTATSGCFEYLSFDDGVTTYETHPTSVRYDIQYGYRITCSGTGNYEITYDCDIPELLLGTRSPCDIIYRYDYEETTIVNNDFISWNISGDNSATYELGISTSVQAEAFLVSDLNGNGAATLQEIKTTHLNLYNQYCNGQSVENTRYIDPEDPYITSIAYNVLNQTGSTNVFIVAKELFIWLKENTAYKVHAGDDSVQPARTTYLLETGDCDDLSFLYISLCRALGIPARFIRGCLVEEDNGVVSAVAHAWVEVFVGGGIGDDEWIPVECACPSKDPDVQVYQNFGIESAGHLRLFKDDGSNESLNVSISGPRAKYDTGMNIEMTPFIEIDNYLALKSESLIIDKDGIRTYE